jgi:hypothetical protein
MNVLELVAKRDTDRIVAYWIAMYLCSFQKMGKIQQTSKIVLRNYCSTL